MPIPAYAEIKDNEGNPIEGSVQVKGREGMSEIMEFDHTVRIPTDEQSGDLTGVRQHKPATLVKPYDKASPLLYDALCNGKNLNEVKVHWYRINKDGKEEEYFTHTLKKAKIADIESYMPNTKNPRKEQFTHMEKVSILYGEITWLYHDGNIEYNDSWTSGR
jgi:type VI secretion system secreted protein Hcp